MSIRIIAGAFKSRTLKAPRGHTTRPTAGRAREALFSILGELSGLRVLDLYAGSGALGIEALSRGAAHVVFVESDHRALGCIRENLDALDAAANASVLADRVERLKLPELLSLGPFDLVLSDPPWARVEQAAIAVSRLVPTLGHSARLVFEHPAGCSPSISGLHKADERSWGDTGMSLWAVPEEPA